jgi:hypothetical protein
MNPYYNPESLDLEMLAFDEPGLSYEFNTLCFWATKNGRVYSAEDSGCSCPTPFEDYEGETQDEVLQKLSRVGSIAQAEAEFDNWNKPSYREEKSLPQSERNELAAWLKAKGMK